MTDELAAAIDGVLEAVEELLFAVTAAGDGGPCPVDGAVLDALRAAYDGYYEAEERERE